MIIDGRLIPKGERLETDLAIIGAGAAGIALARELKDAPFRVALIESGGLELSDATQDLYGGEFGPQEYGPLDSVRLRYFGGTTNHWSGWCRPLDAVDFEARETLGLPGWPVTRGMLDPYYRRAQAIVELGRFAYDDLAYWIAGAKGAALPLAQPGIETRVFQYSPPTRFGARYRDEIAQAQNIRCLLNLNAVDFIARDRRLDAVTLKRLDGAEFALQAKIFVLACGGIENARLLLNADAERAGGIANSSGLVGRNFMDHPLVHNVATLIVFRPDDLGGFHLEIQNGPGGRYRAGLMAPDQLRRSEDLLASLTTVDHISAVWDSDGKRSQFSSAREPDARAEAAIRLAVALAGGKLAPAEYTLGAGLEVAPDEQSRVALLPARDVLGLRRVRVDWRLSDAARESYLKTLDLLGAQLQAPGAGLLRIDRQFLEDWPEQADWACHHMGTTRMASDPRAGVVDANLRTHDLDNFYIAGSSVFPSYGAAPPTLTIVALTLRLADHLRDRFRA